MRMSTHLTSSTAPLDEDLSEQAHRGHGVPSQDPDPAAQFGLDPPSSTLPLLFFAICRGGVLKNQALSSVFWDFLVV